MLAGIAALLGLALPTGAFIDRWATQNSVYQRIDNRFSALKLSVLRWSGKAPPDRPVDVAWRSKPTHLVSLQYLPIRLPNSDGTGGGLQGLPDGRIFYATAYGEFGYLTIDGTPITLPYRLEMNLEALKKHPVFTARNFHFNWIRVTDIDLKKIGEHQYELLVGHHYFDEARQCLEMRLSRGVIDGDSPDIGLVQPFKTIYRATHCLTFAGPERENAIDAYASGGRIVRLDAGKILFSLGDHNWAGVEGYPPLAAMDSSSLGKIVQIDLPSGAVRPFAKGVRNPQGLVLDSKGRVWETEHGPRGGDELNLIVEGGDYGWPQSTYGTDYGPRPWPLNPSQGRHLSGRPPQFSWSPSIGVSNLVEVTSGQFPEWQGDLLVASLANQALRRLRLEGDRIVYDERIPFDGFRIRDITQLPDGRLAMITDQGYVVLLRNGNSSASHPFLDASRQKPRSSDMSAEARERAVAGYYADPAHLSSTTTADADPAVGRGRALFGSLCATCHSLGSDTASSAPNLTGVVGRRVGSADYPYSDGLAGQSAAWTPQRIVEFASNPSALYPGTVMQAVPVSGEHQKDLEAFFRANSPR
jgi:cytochrome c2